MVEDILSVSCQYDFGGLSNRRTGTITFTSEGIKVEGRLSLSGSGGLIGLAIRGAAVAAGVGRVNEFIPWSDVLYAEVKGIIGKRVEIKYRKEGSTKTLRLFVSSESAERIEELVNRMKGSVPVTSDVTHEEPRLEPSPVEEESFTASVPVSEGVDSSFFDVPSSDYRVSSSSRSSFDDLEDFEIVGTATAPVSHRFVDDSDFEVLTPSTSSPAPLEPETTHPMEPFIETSEPEIPTIEGIEDIGLSDIDEQLYSLQEEETSPSDTIRITDLMIFKPDPQKIYLVVTVNTGGIGSESLTLANITAELRDPSGNVVYTETWTESISGEEQITTRELDLSQLGIDLSRLTVKVRVQIGDTEASAEKELGD